MRHDVLEFGIATQCRVLVIATADGEQQFAARRNASTHLSHSMSRFQLANGLAHHTVQTPHCLGWPMACLINPYKPGNLPRPKGLLRGEVSRRSMGSQRPTNRKVRVMNSDFGVCVAYACGPVSCSCSH